MAYPDEDNRPYPERSEQLMYKRKRHPRVEASQMPYSYQVAGPATKPNKQKKIKDTIWLKINGK